MYTLINVYCTFAHEHIFYCVHGMNTFIKTYMGKYILCVKKIECTHLKWAMAPFLGRTSRQGKPALTYALL